MQDTFIEETYSNFWVKEVLQRQHQTTNHFSEKQGIYASFKHCN